MGSNSSKNTSQEITIPESEQQFNNEEVHITPMNKKPLFELEDPRSPTITNRTPLSSPTPFRSWRAIAAAQKDMDPRSPSLHNRTPTVKSTPGRLGEAFDPRSPSLSRTPYGLNSSEEVAFGNSSRKAAGPHRSPHPLSIALSMGLPMEEEEVAEEEAEQTEQPEQSEQDKTIEKLNQTADIASPVSEDEGAKSRKDGASLFDSNMSLANSNTFHPMQSVEIINPKLKSSDDSSMRKRKGDRNDSLCASPLKRSYVAMDAENTYVSQPDKFNLSSSPTTRSPLSTLSTNSQHRGTAVEKSKLSNIFTENMPPAVLS